MNAEKVLVFNPGRFFPEPDRDVTVIVEKSDEFDFEGKRMGFAASLSESVIGSVAMVVAIVSKRSLISSAESAGNDFEVIRWDAGKRELHVKLVKNAFGIARRQ